MTTATVDWQAMVDAVPWVLLVCDEPGRVVSCNRAGARFVQAHGDDAGRLPMALRLIRQSDRGVVALGAEFYQVSVARRGACWVWALVLTTPARTRELIQDLVSDQLASTARRLSEATDTLSHVGQELTEVAASTVTGARKVDALARQLDHDASSASAQATSLWREVASLVRRGAGLSGVVERQVGQTTEDLQGLVGVNRNLLRMADGLELLAKQASVLSVNGQIEAGRSSNATLRVIASQMVEMAKRSGLLARDMQEILATAQSAIPAIISGVEALAGAVGGLRGGIDELEGVVVEEPIKSAGATMDDLASELSVLLASSQRTESCVGDAVGLADGLTTLGSQLGMVASRLRGADHLAPSDAYRAVTLLHLLSDAIEIPSARSAPVGLHDKRPADVLALLVTTAAVMAQRTPGMRPPRRPDGVVTPTQVYCYASELYEALRASLSHRGETFDLHPPPVQDKTPNDVYALVSTLRLRWDGAP